MTERQLHVLRVHVEALESEATHNRELADAIESVLREAKAHAEAEAGRCQCGRHRWVKPVADSIASETWCRGGQITYGNFCSWCGSCLGDKGEAVHSPLYNDDKEEV